MEFNMSRVAQADPIPEYLLSAVEYRDHLNTELAKVNEFLRVAKNSSRSSECESPDFLFVGGSEILGAIRSNRLVSLADSLAGTLRIKGRPSA
jgi:hypothetical protein